MQLIDTAPTDGTVIQGKNAEGDVANVAWKPFGRFGGQWIVDGTQTVFKPVQWEAVAA